MFVFYILNEDAKKEEKARYTPPDNWSGEYKGIKDILDTTEWSRLSFEKFDPNNKKHVKLLPELIGGTYLWCEKRAVVTA
jgi:hypothetical protein